MDEDRAGGGAGAGGAGDGPRSGAGSKGKVSDGIRQGLGVLSALKDALEETIQEARARGDLSPEKAKEAMRSAVAKAQEMAGEARERLDFVPRAEYDRLRDQMEAMKARLDALERRPGEGPPPGPTGP